MDTRKDYVAPAIAAEDNLEQTSLACTATEDWPGVTPGPGGTFAGPWPQCTVDVSKGGTMDLLCSVPLPDPGAVVALS